MPVYTYRCTNCGVEFDKQQSFSENTLVRCPECGKKTLKKVFQPVGIVFKGSGFYATDHHSPSGQASKKIDDQAEKAEKTEKPEKKEPESKKAGDEPAKPAITESKPEKKE